jgi:hypothetical protein
MKLTLSNAWLRLLFVSACAATASADGMRSVYLLPMANGLDLFLANRLTGSGEFQVVTDAKKAGAVFTDRLGEGFERRLAELTTPPPPKDDAGKAGSKKDDKEGGARDVETKLEGVVQTPISTFGGGKGTVFLVEVASRRVLWSTFAAPRDNSPRQLDRTAALIVNRLKKEPSRQ